MTKVDERDPMLFEQDVLGLALESLRARQASDLSPASSRPYRRHTVALAIAAAGLAIAIALPIALPGGRTGGADPAAAALLHRVAIRAAHQPPDPAPGPGQFLYSRSESAFTMLYVVGNGETFLFQARGIRESWIALNGSGRVLNTPEPITFPTEHDRATWVAAGKPSLEWVVEGDSEFEDLNPGELTLRDLTDLPTDPEELRDVIESRELIGGPGGDWETFVIIGDLLRETRTTPQVRAALYQVAAELPGVELVGRVLDGASRPGVAVAYTNPSGDSRSRFELIFDPKTAELLSEAEVLVADTTVDVQSGGAGAVYGAVGPAGTRTYATTYLISGVVDSTTETL